MILDALNPQPENKGLEKRAIILLDGVEQLRVVAADDERGLVIRVQTGANGEAIFDGDRARIERVKGKVTIFDPQTFVVKPFRVWINGYGEHTYYTRTRGKALARAWGDFGSLADSLTFKEFLKMVRAYRTTAPEDFGAPIIVCGKPAFFVTSNRQYVQFVRPDSDVILNSHPYDVEPEHLRPDTYRKASA